MSIDRRRALTRIRAAAVAGGFAAAVLGLACGDRRTDSLPESWDNEQRPNLLIVLVDTLRRDHLGAYGYPLPTSPHIDTFAAESFRFDRAYAHSTWTKPSIATLFTSVYPEQHGLRRVGENREGVFQTGKLPKDLVTLAERFRRAGYATGGFGANVHVQKKTGFGQGFRRFYSKRLDTAYQLNALLEDWLDSVDADVPFFGYLHYMDVHWPYDRRLPDEEGRFGRTDVEPLPPENWALVARWAEKHLNPETLASIRARYDEEIAFMDRAFGELIEWLRERRLLDETIVVFVADHGEGFHEHGQLQHGFAPFEEVAAVPLLMRLPPVYDLEPRAVAEPVGLVDLMPTLLDLVGLESAAQAQGRSFVPELLGRRQNERPVYSEGAGVSSMRDADHTLMVAPDGVRSCFDNARDPEQLTPLEMQSANACEQLAATLDGLVQGLESADAGAQADATVTLDEDEIRELRALGYIE